MDTVEAELIHGSYGLVVIPDSDTIERSYQLAEDLFPNDTEYVVRNGFLPHITLYHSRFKDIPVSWISKQVSQLNEMLHGVEFQLSELHCYGDKFIFWNIDPEYESYHLVKSAHMKALELAKFLDQDAPRRSDEEGIKLSPQEQENSVKFNHPLVRDLYTPHITLAYDERASKFLAQGATAKWSMRVGRVEFVEIGFPGVVNHIVSLDG